MTKKEFDYWWGQTQKSKWAWKRDYITGENSRLRSERENNPALYRELFYKGGEDGIYIEIDGTGKVEVGEYQGAYPHIGEAIFTTKHKNNPMHKGKPAENFEDALTAIMERLGVQFLIDILAVN